MISLVSGRCALPTGGNVQAQHFVGAQAFKYIYVFTADFFRILGGSRPDDYAPAPGLRQADEFLQ